MRRGNCIGSNKKKIKSSNNNRIKVGELYFKSMKVTNPTVSLLRRQTPEHHYYYSCYHCYNISKATFSTIDEYERHIVMNHKPSTIGYPGFPDIEKLELERVRDKQGHGTITSRGLMKLTRI